MGHQELPSPVCVLLVPLFFPVQLADSVFVLISCPPSQSDFHFRIWGLRKNKMEGKGKIETEEYVVAMIYLEVQRGMKFSDSEVRGE